MRRPLRKKGAAGFVLLEILVSLVIAILIFSGVLLSVNSCLVFLKRSENKSRAMSVTVTTLDRYLSKSYSALVPGTATGRETFGENTVFNWQAVVSEEGEGPAATRVPYKKIVVVTSYTEEGANGAIIPKQIRLSNIVPYPFIHTQVLHEMPADIVAPVVPSGTLAAPRYATLKTLQVNYSVAKDMMIIYNVAIKNTSVTGLQEVDTILTRCLLDGVYQPIETRTPIISQLLISNVVGINGVRAGPHTIELQWFKDTAQGRTILKEINVIAVACEHK